MIKVPSLFNERDSGDASTGTIEMTGPRILITYQVDVGSQRRSTIRTPFRQNNGSQGGAVPGMHWFRRQRRGINQCPLPIHVFDIAMGRADFQGHYVLTSPERSL
jgi:hypothetical protein